jgi:threonine/homoserine/homoserine lactone efflux protein
MFVIMFIVMLLLSLSAVVVSAMKIKRYYQRKREAEALVNELESSKEVDREENVL